MAAYLLPGYRTFVISTELTVTGSLNIFHKETEKHVPYCLGTNICVLNKK